MPRHSILAPGVALLVTPAGHAMGPAAWLAIPRAIVLLVCAIVMASPATAQGDVHSRARSLLRDAAQSAWAIPVIQQRISALSQVATEQARLGERESAQANLKAAFELYETLEPGERWAVASMFALRADFPTALKIVERVEDPARRDHIYERLLKHWMRTGKDPVVMELLSRFHGEGAREAATLQALEACRGLCDLPYMSALSARMGSKQNQAIAAAILEAERAQKVGSGNAPSTALEIAAIIPDDEPPQVSGLSFPLSCHSESPILARDLAFKGVAEVQVSAGNRESARRTAARISDPAVRAQVETLVLESFARAGDFTAALEILEAMPTQGCKDAATEKLVAEEWRAGRHESALRRARGLSDAGGRAYALFGMAVAEPRESRARVLPLLQEAATEAAKMGDDRGRGSLLAAIARVQAEAGATQAARAALEGMPASSPAASSSSVVIPGAESFAAADDADAAMALLRGQSEEQRAAGIRRVAARVAVRKAPTDLVAWIRSLASPYEQSLAFVGAAEGILRARRAPQP